MADGSTSPPEDGETADAEAQNAEAQGAEARDAEAQDVEAQFPPPAAPVAGEDRGAETAAPDADGGLTTLAPGRVLSDRYEIRFLVGVGSAGAVYAAHDRIRGEAVALKVLLPSLQADTGARERFRAAARIWSTLSHPHIARVYDMQRDGDSDFLTMELLEGKTLREEMETRAAANRPFRLDEVRRTAAALFAALRYAHRFTVHGNVRPANVWLCPDGTVKLTDFGMALSDAAIARSAHVAPEQREAGDALAPQADQYSVAAVLYEMLTGEVPSAGERPGPRFRHVSRALSGIIRALAENPADRHGDIESFARTVSPRAGSRRSRAPLAGTLAFAAVGGAAAYALWGQIETWLPRHESPQQQVRPEATAPKPPPVDAVAPKPPRARVAVAEQRRGAGREAGAGAPVREEPRAEVDASRGGPTPTPNAKVAPEVTGATADTARTVQGPPRGAGPAGRAAWTVQVAATDDPKAAERMVGDLKRRAYDAFVVEVARGETRWYRVRVGRLHTTQDASALRGRLQAEAGFSDAYVTRID